jgi:hypothetical protein
MEILKRDGKYYRLQEVEEGFDIDREIGKLEEESETKRVEAKKLKKERDKIEE